MNTIVIAAIALIVLIVMVLIFTGQISKFRQGIDDCTKKGGYSRSSDAECIDQGGIPNGPYITYDGGKRITTQADNGMVCCVFKK